METITRADLNFYHKKISARLLHAESKHPEGPKFHNLVSEVEEVQEAIKRDSYKQTIYELYDVITVAIRLIRKYEDYSNHASGD
jgi:NTP pyrophosphatase (non-canonical NTP hydrolase)